MNKVIQSGSLVYKKDQAKRLDLFLVEELKEYSRNLIQNSIEQGRVTVNDKTQKSKYQLSTGDKIVFEIVDKDIDISDIPVEKIPLNIIFEDENVIVINKQAGLSSHPTPNERTHTLVNALLGYYEGIAEAVHDPDSSKSRIRAGIVHRLDKDTSGVMIVAKNSLALRFLSQQIKDREVEKCYLALCLGLPSQERGQWINHLGRDSNNRKRFSEVGEKRGKKAITNYDTVLSYPYGRHTISLLRLNIETGRTHQIRAQLLLHHLPIIGDQLYSTQESSAISLKLGAKRQCLHSSSLKIILPGSSSKSHFECDLAPEISHIIDRLTN